MRHVPCHEPEACFEKFFSLRCHRWIFPPIHSHVQHCFEVSESAPKVYDRTGSLQYVGDKSRNLATVLGTRANAKSISASIVCRPRLKRMLARARSGRRPMASSTCDGSIAPDEHAAPVETARPFKSSAITSASPSM